MTLTVGVPGEVKNSEHRVAITPDGVRELSEHGVDVLVEQGAGESSAIDDAEYKAAGAKIVPTPEDVGSAELVCKVKEPQPEELALPRRPRALHLPPPRRLPDGRGALLTAGTAGVAYETVQLENGELPLLAPMSEVAGRMATQIGAHYLERENGGAGRAARWSTRGAAGPGGGDRRRERRVELRVDRRGHGGRGCVARQEHRPPPLGATRSTRAAS